MPSPYLASVEFRDVVPGSAMFGSNIIATTDARYGEGIYFPTEDTDDVIIVDHKIDAVIQEPDMENLLGPNAEIVAGVPRSTATETRAAWPSGPEATVEPTPTPARESTAIEDAEPESTEDEPLGLW